MIDFGFIPWGNPTYTNLQYVGLGSFACPEAENREGDPDAKKH
jgi:hypothetical protein